MTLRTLIVRSLRHHWRAHLGVLLGAAIGSAALIGALVVGDSVRGSLRERALERLGWIEAALDGGDRLFTQKLAESAIPVNRAKPSALNAWNFDAVLKLPGTASRADGTARANHVNVLGVGYWSFWQPNRITNARPAFALIPKDSVVLNEALAAQLQAKPGDEIVLRLHKPSTLSRDAPITPSSDATVALRLKVHGIATAPYLGNFSLRSGQSPPLNAFLLINDLAPAAGLPGKANLILAGDFRTLQMAWDTRLQLWWDRVRSRLPGYSPVSRMARQSEIPLTELRMALQPALADYSLELRVLTNQNVLELRSDRIFLDPAVRAAVFSPATNPAPRDPVPFWAATWNGPPSASTNTIPNQLLALLAQPALTYLVNLIGAGTNTAPYSMVTAAGAPWTPPEMLDDEILISEWLADDLRVKPGDEIGLTYFEPESGGRLTERTNTFRVRGIVPAELPWADRTLMPEFPGLEKAESTADWDTAFPLVHKIRPQDEAYWKKFRGTPKAFVTLAAGQKMWGNRFGALTAIRFAMPTNGLPIAPGFSPVPRDRQGEEPFETVSPTNALTDTGLKPGANGSSSQATNSLAAFRGSLEATLLANLKPEDVGLRFEPVRAQALKAAEQSQDFGGLFLGFSFFLIAAALLLMALLFQLGVEQRAAEIGTLLALGFRPKQVRRLWLLEGAALALLGSLVGALGGVGYAKAMLHGLTTLWRDAVGGSTLQFHVTAQSLVIGIASSVIAAVLAIWLTLRGMARQPARELLAGEVRSPKPKARNRARWIALGALVAALGSVAWAWMKGDTANAEVFFSAGGLLLISGLAFVSHWLARQSRSGVPPDKAPSGTEGRRDAGTTLAALALRGAARRRNRSLATVALLACGSFLIASIGVFRLDANRDATRRESGTGGFALIGEATVPLTQDLNSRAGREAFGLSEQDLAGVNVVPFRVREGDEASCLNLNRAQKPRLLGVHPELMGERFTFSIGSRWRGLRSDIGQSSRLSPSPEVAEKSGTGGTRVLREEIPAVGDAASIQWAMGKKINDTIEYVDDRGQPFKVRIVGAVANSILQGSLVIEEAEFVKRFPNESGYKFFLLDAPTNRVAEVSAALSRALQDYGFELTPAARRLAQFNAVQNTYLGTFQILGSLGLLLGSAGLGVVVLRNVLERRGELAVLLAVGFRRRRLQRLVLGEHAALLLLGLGVGLAAAAVAVLPSLLSPGTQLPWASLALTLAAVLVNGFGWTWLATRYALRGNLLAALRNE